MGSPAKPGTAQQQLSTIKAKGVSVLRADELYHQTIRDYIAEIKKEGEEGKISRHALKFMKESNGVKMVENLKWQIGLTGNFEEISAVTRDLRLDMDRGCANGPATIRHHKRRTVVLKKPSHQLSEEISIPHKKPGEMKPRPTYDDLMKHLVTAEHATHKCANGLIAQRRSKEEEEKARKAYAVDVFEGLEELLDYKRRMTAIEYVQKRDFRSSAIKIDEAKKWTTEEDLVRELQMLEALFGKDEEEGQTGLTVLKDRMADLTNAWNAYKGEGGDKRSWRSPLLYINQYIKGILYKSEVPVMSDNVTTFPPLAVTPQPDSMLPSNAEAAHLSLSATGDRRDSMANDKEQDASFLATLTETSAMDGTQTSLDENSSSLLDSNPNPKDSLLDSHSSVEPMTSTVNEQSAMQTSQMVENGSTEVDNSKNSDKKYRSWLGNTSATLKKWNASSSKAFAAMATRTKRRKHPLDVDRFGVSIITGELLDKEHQHKSLRDIIGEENQMLSWEARNIITQFYMMEQRDIDHVIRDSRPSILIDDMIASFDDLDFAAAAHDGNISYLKAILQYRLRHQEYDDIIPMESRTLNGHTAFHAAFLEILRAEDPAERNKDANSLQRNKQELATDVDSLATSQQPLKSRPVDIARLERCLEMLLKNGANINCYQLGIKIFDCMTPLHHATLRSNHARMEWLLKHGADVNIGTSVSGTTPLMLVHLSKTQTPTPQAARKGGSETLAVLLNYKVDVIQTDYEGRTALHHAAVRGDIYVVRTLILAGVDKNIKSKKGQTAAQEARLLDRMLISTTILSFEPGDYKAGRLLDHLAVLHKLKTGQPIRTATPL